MAMWAAAAEAASMRVALAEVIATMMKAVMSLQKAVAMALVAMA